jgi:hypothetical protein
LQSPQGTLSSNKQEQKQQSNENAEVHKSNAEDPKTAENNINTPERRSTVSKKQCFPYWKILIKYTNL